METSSLQHKVNSDILDFDDDSKHYVYEEIKLGHHKEQEVQKASTSSSRDATSDGESYDPTIRILLRIMKVVLENGSIIRTTLALKARVNYTILAKHLEWLEKRRLIEMFVDDGKISVRLNAEGIEFAYRLSGLGY